MRKSTANLRSGWPCGTQLRSGSVRLPAKRGMPCRGSDSKEPRASRSGTISQRASGALEKPYAEIYGEPSERVAMRNTIKERIRPAACQAWDALPWKRLKGTSSLPQWNNLSACERGAREAVCGNLRRTFGAGGHAEHN